VSILAHGGDAGAALTSAALVAVVLLGVLHGVNPGMGWLFAVSYGLQERRRSALLRALVPIGIGHEASVAVMAAAIVLFSSAVTRATVMAVTGVTLMAFGAWMLLRRRHFRWVGMRLTPLQLAWWSFLMSTVTGAGLMLAPVLLGRPAAGPDPLVVEALDGRLAVAFAVALVHAAAMVATSAVVALAVYQVLGLRVLTRAWVNLDKVWAFAFIAAGAFVWLQ
jgi:hypothetical protein